MSDAVHSDQSLVPAGARPAARILLFDPQERLLLMQARNPSPCETFWITPGGGVEPGETFAAAARRELREETGLDAEIGPCVWFREHLYSWNGRPPRLLYERFFVARTDVCEVVPQQQDDYVIGHRWWSFSEIQASTDVFAPRRLAEFLTTILRGDYPAEAIDVGV